MQDIPIGNHIPYVTFENSGICSSGYLLADIAEFFIIDKHGFYINGLGGVREGIGPQPVDYSPKTVAGSSIPIGNGPIDVSWNA